MEQTGVLFLFRLRVSSDVKLLCRSNSGITSFRPPSSLDASNPLLCQSVLYFITDSTARLSWSPEVRDPGNKDLLFQILFLVQHFCHSFRISKLITYKSHSFFLSLPLKFISKGVFLYLCIWSLSSWGSSASKLLKRIPSSSSQETIEGILFKSPPKANIKMEQREHFYSLRRLGSSATEKIMGKAGRILMYLSGLWESSELLK